MQFDEPQPVARATIKPPSVLSVDTERVDVFLRPTENGRFRWFRADGSPTVVDGPTVENASRAALIVWDSWRLEED